MPKCRYAHSTECAPFQREDRYCDCCPADVEGIRRRDAEACARLAQVVTDMTPDQLDALAEALKQLQG